MRSRRTSILNPLVCFSCLVFHKIKILNFFLPWEEEKRSCSSTTLTRTQLHEKHSKSKLSINIAEFNAPDRYPQKKIPFLAAASKKIEALEKKWTRERNSDTERGMKFWWWWWRRRKKEHQDDVHVTKHVSYAADVCVYLRRINIRCRVWWLLSWPFYSNVTRAVHVLFQGSIYASCGRGSSLSTHTPHVPDVPAFQIHIN